MTCESLVSVNWLEEQLAKDDPGQLVILDVSWSSSKDMREHFNTEHIPGAVYLSVLDGKHTDLFPRNLPTVDPFEESAKAAGVNADSHVVVYSDSDACGFFVSGRAWWTFKLFGHQNVSVLNGGLQKWKSAGGKLSNEAPSPKRGNFTCASADSLRTTYDVMVDNQESSGRQVCDSRPQTTYCGPESHGHIKGAHTLPLSELINTETGTLKDIENLKKEFSKAGLDLSKPLISYCNSGMSSCTLALTAAMCGCDSVAVYHGGFTEWKKRAPNDEIE